MSAYGNPQPYPLPDLERRAIEGRIKVARTIAATSDRPYTAAAWSRIVDELLDHLAEIDARAATAAMERGTS